VLLKPVKRIGDIKANAAEVLSKIAEDREPRVSTQNGEAKAALRDLLVIGRRKRRGRC